jgi:hypothetical protein
MLASGMRIRRHIREILMSAAASVVSGAVFIVALIHQFALVEVAASLLTWLQIFFLTSTIGDALEDNEKRNQPRDVAVVALTMALVAFFAIRDLRH